MDNSGHGIACKYQNDIGLKNDADVLLFEDFADYNNAVQTHMSSNWDVGKRWTFYNINEQSTFDTAAKGGGKSLKLTLPVSSEELAMGFWQWLDEDVYASADQATPPNFFGKKGGYDELFLRYYQKFDDEYDVNGSNHCGPNLSSWYYKRPYGQASPGFKANGYNKLLVSNEFWRENNIGDPPGLWNFYVYHPNQGGLYGDHLYPTGERSVSEGLQSQLALSSDFVPRPNFRPQRGRWYCYELRVKLNSVPEEGIYRFTGDNTFGGDRGAVTVLKAPHYLSDGRITSWVDGQVMADYDNLVLRYTNDLKLDRLEFGLHAKKSFVENSIQYSNIVLATAYIGPVRG